MKLPVVNAPTIATTLPLSGKKVFFRPFVVREQKALLLAQESEDEDTIYATIKDVINTCTNGAVELGKMPLPDLSWLFLQMKISSSGPEQRIILTCDACSKEIPMNYDLNGASVDTSNLNLRIDLTPSVGLEFRWPTMDDYIDAFRAKDSSIKYIYKIVVKIWDEHQVYTKDVDYTEEEFNTWVHELNDSQLDQIKNFMDSIPELRQDLTFSCPHCGEKHSKRLEGLQDFFRLDDDQ